MNVSAAHVERIKLAISKHGGAEDPETRQRYLDGDFPNRIMVDSLERRFRWDMFNQARNWHDKSLLSDLLDEGNEWWHIDEVLTKVIEPLGVSGS